MRDRGRFLIYGAAGYTGRLLVERSLARGLAPILAGRRAASLAELGTSTRCETRAAPLSDAEGMARLLDGVSVVLSAAGPFSQTAGPLMDACLNAGAHYLDISGEIAAFEAARARGPRARSSGVMLMPGVGFDVVPSDCLAAHVARALPGATHLRLGVSGLGLVSKGSALTLCEQLGQPLTVRRNGQLTALPQGSLQRNFDFGRGAQRCSAVSWADVASAHYTTGIDNIEVYFESNALVRATLAWSRYAGWALGTPAGQAWLKAHTIYVPLGPAPEARRARSATIVAEASDPSGHRVSARLVAPEAYTTTALTAVAIAERVLLGDAEPGFNTPARVYGPDFVLGIQGIHRDPPRYADQVVEFRQ